MTCLLQAGFVVPSCKDKFLLGSVIDSQLFQPAKRTGNNYLVNTLAILLAHTVIASLIRLLSDGNLSALEGLISY